MLPSLPLARSGYTLHIYTMGQGGLRPSTHIARLMCPDGKVSHEWTTVCYRWQLGWKIDSLRYGLDGLIEPDEDVPTYHSETQPPDRGLRQHQVSFAL
jgi:hypothetical protein